MTTLKECKEWFEANYLDGDKIQTGQFLSSKECFDAIISSHIEYLEETQSRLKIRQKGWLGKEEDGSDRHECYDELQLEISHLQSQIEEAKLLLSEMK